jgi:hypothetical protein
MYGVNKEAPKKHARAKVKLEAEVKISLTSELPKVKWVTVLPGITIQSRHKVHC